ncbi:MAG: response regulator, partial [Raoultibacter sp.]
MSTILVVDDDRDLSTIVTRFLESEGYEVASATSAEEAYELLTAQTYDLILLDINLPGDDGF